MATFLLLYRGIKEDRFLYCLLDYGDRCRPAHHQRNLAMFKGIGVLPQRAENRIPGAMRIGNYWAIPEDAVKPKDGRIKSGRYIKKKTEE